MTAIVGLEHPGGVTIGTDSFYGDEEWRDIMDAPRWFRRGPCLIAYAGAVRTAQLFEHAPPFRLRRKGESAMRYLVGVVARALQETHAGVGRPIKEEDECSFMVGYEGKLYCILGGFDVIRSKHGYAAIGAGERYALGALTALATSAPSLSPRERLEAALAAAAKHSPAVARPFHFIDLPAG